MPTVSYGLRISRENHIFDQTIEVYRAAVNYLMDIVSLHYDMLAAAEPTVSATVQQVRQGIMEHLVHSTRENTAASLLRNPIRIPPCSSSHDFSPPVRL